MHVIETSLRFSSVSKINGHIRSHCFTNSKCATSMKRHGSAETLIYARSGPLFFNSIAFNFSADTPFIYLHLPTSEVTPICKLSNERNKTSIFFACDLSIKYFKANFFMHLCDSLNEMFGYIFLQFNVHKLC